jgi:hypothetical protein
MTTSQLSHKILAAHTRVAQFIALCSASHLAEARRISLAVAGLIACKDVSLFEAFSCPWTPPSTFYKLR